MKTKRIITRPYRLQEKPLPPALHLEFSAPSAAEKFSAWVYHLERDCQQLKTLRKWHKEAKNPTEKKDYAHEREKRFQGIKKGMYWLQHFLVQHGVTEPLEPNPKLTARELKRIQKTCKACNVEAIIDNLLLPNIHHLEILTTELRLENRSTEIVLASVGNMLELKDLKQQLADAKKVYNQAIHVIHKNNVEENTKNEKTQPEYCTGVYTPIKK